VTLKILPIYAGNEAFSQAARVSTVLALLQTDISEFEFLPVQNQLPDTISKDHLVLYFAYEPGNFLEAIKTLREDQKKSIIAFDSSRDVQPLTFLEESQILGLVTYKAVSDWMDHTPSRFQLMGQGYGIYGLKVFFDETVFDKNDAQISSKNYCLFHDQSQPSLSSDMSKYLQVVLKHHLMPDA
jgi:hypothetical protein